MINVHHHIEKLGLDGSLTYFVACSGGVDSMALLYAMNAAGLDTHALHVNYGLRGADSDNDAQLVESFCTERNIPFQIKKSELADKLKSGGNVQLEARNDRYSWFQEILNESAKNRVVLAHHRDDQIETFYLNLARGAGVLGLSAMPLEHKKIIRPLLTLSKAQLIDYAKKQLIPWREDRTNAESKYRRNKLRNVILPDLFNQIPSLEESVLIIIDKMQELQRSLEDKTNALRKSLLNDMFIAHNVFNQLSELEQVELFRSIGMSFNELQEIRKIKNIGGSVRVKSSHCDLIVKDREGFSLIHLSELNKLPELVIDEVESLPPAYTKNEVYIDADKIDGELNLRRWQIGDRIKPIGLNGSKLISKVIKEGKLSSHEKMQTTIVSDNADILWCPGLCVGRTALANSDSKRILKVSLNPPRAQE